MMSSKHPGAGLSGELALSGPGSQAGLVARVAAIAEGDQGALEELYGVTCQLVLSLARRILGDPDDAEEAAVDVYHYVWQRAEQYDASRGSVRRWLAIITRGRAIDRMRSRESRRAREGQVPDFMPGPEAFPDPIPGPEAALLASERDDALERALRSLSDRDRRVIERAFFHGQTHQEIAAALGEPLGTIKGQIRRGLIKLHRHLKTWEADR